MSSKSTTRNVKDEGVTHRVIGLGTNIVGKPYEPPKASGRLLLTQAARDSIAKERPLIRVMNTGEEVPDDIQEGDILLIAMEPAKYDDLIPGQEVVVIPYEFVLARYERNVPKNQ